MKTSLVDLHILKDTLTPFKNYTYVLVDNVSREAVLIDAACNKKELERLVATKQIIPRYLLLTHTHPDHIRLVSWLTKKFHVQVCLAEAEAYFYDYYVPNMKLLKDKETVNIGETSIECILTPGHSKGSMCYRVNNQLFTGDTVFIEGCGLCTSRGGSPVEMYESIQKLKELISYDTYIYPGHSYGISPGQTLSYVLDHNIYFAIEDQPTFIEFRMRKCQKGLFNFK